MKRIASLLVLLCVLFASCEVKTVDTVTVQTGEKYYWVSKTSMLTSDNIYIQFVSGDTFLYSFHGSEIQGNYRLDSGIVIMTRDDSSDFGTFEVLDEGRELKHTDISDTYQTGPRDSYDRG